MDPMNWRTSTRSTGNGECVEAASTKGTILVRDTKDRHGRTLTVSATAWTKFTSTIK